MERILKWMSSSKDDGELVVEGREVWYGLHRTNVATVNSLLRLCLIHDETINEAPVRRYVLNEEGRAIITRPNYKPMIVEHLRKRYAD